MWCVILTPSLLCCLFLCVSLSPFVEWWIVRCWCRFCAFILTLLQLLPVRGTDCFLCPSNIGILISFFLSLFLFIYFCLQRTQTGSPRKICSPFKQPQQLCRREFSTFFQTHANLHVSCSHSHIQRVSTVWKVSINKPNWCVWPSTVNKLLNTTLPAFFSKCAIGL